MFSATKQFTDVLDAKNVRYSYDGETKDGKKDWLTIPFNLDNTSVKVVFVFGQDGEDAAVRVFNVVTNVGSGRTAAVLRAINGINKQFRFAKAVLDPDDNTVQFEADISFRSTDIGEVCYEIMVRMINIVDDAFPTLMHAMYS